MDPGYWAERWRNGQIGFHLADVNRLLPRHAGQLPQPPARVLVPLCGKSHDLGWLADRGHQVVGIEFVEQAARAFFEERGIDPQVGTLGAHVSLSAGRVTIVVADFFAVDATAVGRFPAMWDRAALIAMPPDQQRRYVQQLRALATDDARVLLATFEHDLGSGPPFSVSGADLERLAQRLFRCQMLQDQDILSEEPRFRERGATRLREQLFLLQPL
jgi:thiopurine S-methyltransferase